jgi:transcriptional regulator with XRE-family HTH domain
MATNLFNLKTVVDRLERDLALPVETLAAALDVDRRTIQRWRNNESVPQGKTRERLGELLALRDRLLEVMGSREAIHGWLQAESRYLGGFTPAEALKAGRIDRVAADLDGLIGGIYD